MYSQVFTETFSCLGDRIQGYLNGSESNELLDRAIKQTTSLNPLFTPFMQRSALLAISRHFLNKKILDGWLKEYSCKIKERTESVAVIMAGNLPLVGFHDLLAGVASGCRVTIKSSSKDPFLIKAIVNMLIETDEYWGSRISFSDRPPVNADMVIATGSHSSAAFFESYYSKLPKIVRGTRFSFAVITGEESEEQIERLSQDVFLYYGMGCRSVSTLFIPFGYNINSLAERLGRFSNLGDNPYYMDSYRYQRAIATMSGEEFADGGSFILRKNISPPPPLSVVSVVEYKGIGEVDDYLRNNFDSVQCAVNFESSGKRISFGESQFPAIDEYADGVNTLEFILRNC